MRKGNAKYFPYAQCSKAADKRTWEAEKDVYLQYTTKKCIILQVSTGKNKQLKNCL